MDTPVIAQRAPIPVDVEAGKQYFWCACGKSESQPFCDGSHKGSTFTSVKYVAEESKQVYFCCCKQSKASPLCDGSHKTLDDATEAQ
jgi:CDGSH-type Zn-finger protein